jgi:peptide/nickel transport system ATP-binding protein
LTALETRELTVRFGRGASSLTAVDRVDLLVPERTIVGLVGESGSGKSTLARALVGLTPIASGDVLLDGVSAVRGRGRRVSSHRRLQMVFQDPFSSLNPRMTVGAAVAEALTVGRRSGRDSPRRSVADYLELVHLDTEVKDQLPSRLSGGQRQRVAIARALAARPEVLIADEITSALDVSVQSAVLNLMRDLQQQLGISMVFISHNLATVRYVSDMLAVMYLSRLVEVGSTESVVSAPQHPYTQSLLRAVPRLGVRISPEAESAVEEAEPPDPHDPPAGCRLHPRCPIGPAVDPSRQICIDVDPQDDAKSRFHQAACHFAAPAPAAAEDAGGVMEPARPGRSDGI